MPIKNNLLLVLSKPGQIQHKTRGISGGIIGGNNTEISKL